MMELSKEGQREQDAYDAMVINQVLMPLTRRAYKALENGTSNNDLADLYVTLMTLIEISEMPTPVPEEAASELGMRLRGGPAPIPDTKNVVINTVKSVE